MKITTNILSLATIMCLTIFILSCTEKKKDTIVERPEITVELNIDSLFINLNEASIDEKGRIIDQKMQRLHKRAGFNGVVLYAEQGQVVIKKAYGWRNLPKRRDSISVDDQFQLGSVSKMFTAEAVMILKYRGLLDYDDDICKYITDFPYQGITIRNLLNHRSGLMRYEGVAHEYWKNKGAPLFNDDIIELLKEHSPSPYSKPDKNFHYNNINYALLATIVERVSGQHFEDFMNDNIFKPIGMDHSFIYAMRDDTLVSKYIEQGVPGYNLDKRVIKAQNDYLNGVMGDKIMYSTIDDLYRFSIALDYNLLLPDSIQREAFEPGSPKQKSGENYGFGWRMHKRHPGAVYHYGWWKGFRSFFIKDIENNRVLIALTNTDKGPGSETLWEVLRNNGPELPEAFVNIDFLESDNHLSLPFAPNHQ